MYNNITTVSIPRNQLGRILLMANRTYLCIDLKSFYASVECMERERDPMTTNLVVADQSRTAKTICLAVSPSLKEYGISGRPRLFEIEQAVKRINAERLLKAPGHEFVGSSDDCIELAAYPELSLSYVIAVPRMAHYMEWSTRIYHIYLKYIAPEDIHVYSTDGFLACGKRVCKEVRAKWSLHDGGYCQMLTWKRNGLPQ